jgi:hypothetical protein
VIISGQGLVGVAQARLPGIYAYGTNATTWVKAVLPLIATEVFLGKGTIPSPIEFGIVKTDSMNTCKR